MTTKLHPFWWLKAPAFIPEFYDGFETGDLSKWTSTSQVQIVTTPVHHGSYAAQSANGIGLSILRHELASPVAGYFLRAWVYFHDPPESIIRALLSVATASYIIGDVGINADGVNRVLRLTDYLGNAYDGTTQVTAGWHCVEIETHKGAGATINVWLDSNLEITLTIDNPNEDINAFDIYLDFSGIEKTEIDCVLASETDPTCAYHSDIGV